MSAVARTDKDWSQIDRADALAEDIRRVAERVGDEIKNAARFGGARANSVTLTQMADGSSRQAALIYFENTDGSWQTVRLAQPAPGHAGPWAIKAFPTETREIFDGELV